MIHYKDMTFCPFYHDCHNAHSCDRALTLKVQEAAAKMGLPISRFAQEPSCYKEITNETTQANTNT